MIGIFDSGIGGSSVFKEILKELPNYKYIYYSDSYNNPYGEKSEAELKMITSNIVKYLINQGCKIIVIACNTASTICKEYLRSKFDIPIIAIEPAYKMVYDYNYSGKTLILGTKGTLNSVNFQDLYHKYDNHNTIIYECNNLANLIENDKQEEIRDYLNNNIKQFLGVSNVVLGCTHYPLIKEELKKVLGNVNFFDGSIGVVKQLKKTIEEIKLPESTYNLKFIDTSNDIKKEERFLNILKTSSK